MIGVSDWRIGAAALAVFFGAVGTSSGQNPEPFRAHAMFGDHMVLQRDKPARIWGVGPAGGRVEATLDGRSAAGDVDEAGRWTLELPARPAGGPYQLKLVLREGEGGEPIADKTYEDVMVGDVWLVSGQSNAAFGVRGTTAAKEALKAADIPRLRLNGGKGWARSDAGAAQRFSAVGWYFGEELSKAMPETPIGLISRCWGGKAVASFLSPEALDADPVLRERFVEPWRRYEKIQPHLRTMLEMTPRRHRPLASVPRGGGALSKVYRDRLGEVFPYTLKGALWYQGESDAWGFPIASVYERGLRVLIEEWRERAHAPDLPVVIFQLPHYAPDLAPRPKDPAPWSLVQEAQARIAADTRNVGLAVGIDTGGDDIHPPTKRFFARRAAATARGMVYGHAVPYHGPTFREMTVEGDVATIHFDHAEGLADAGAMDDPPTSIKPPKSRHLGFCLAGADRVFYWADEARIEGRTVVLRSEHVAEPVAARYAFWEAGPWSLVNGAGLPAGPFRTDDWSWDLLDDLPRDAWPRRLAAVAASRAPTIDGKLDEAVWRRGPEGAGPPKVASGFRKTHALGGAPAPTRVRVAHDENALYIAFDCRLPSGRPPKAEAARDDDRAIWADDVVEVVVDADGDGRSYHRVAVNPKGIVYDEAGYAGDTVDELPLLMSALKMTRKSEVRWSSRAEVRSVVRDDAEGQGGRWTVEMKLPLASLEIGGDDRVRRMGVQFVRSFADVHASYEWTPTGRDRSTGAMMPPSSRGGYAAFHAPSRLGELVFEPSPTPAAD